MSEAHRKRMKTVKEAKEFLAMSGYCPDCGNTQCICKMSQKPREFFFCDDCEALYHELQDQCSNCNNYDFIHVIEKSAYDALQKDYADCDHVRREQKMEMEQVKAELEQARKDFTATNDSIHKMRNDNFKRAEDLKAENEKLRERIKQLETKER